MANTVDLHVENLMPLRHSKRARKMKIEFEV